MISLIYVGVGSILENWSEERGVVKKPLSLNRKRNPRIKEPREEETLLIGIKVL